MLRVKSDLSAAGKYRPISVNLIPDAARVFHQLKVVVLGWVIDKTRSLLFSASGSGGSLAVPGARLTSLPE